MNYYLKVALITLVISVVVAEAAGPQLGFRGYIVPFVNSLLSGDTSPSAEIATLELTTEEPAPKISKTQGISSSQAMETCVTAVKQVTLHPDFTQVPAISAQEQGRQFQIVWDKISPVRTMNADGQEVSLLATCHVDAATGGIALFSINGRSLVSSLDASTGLTGNWKVERNVSEVDNSTNVTVRATAVSSIDIAGETATPQLVLHCGEDKTIVYIGMGGSVGAGTIMVDSRIGNEESRSRWSISTDRRNIFPDGQYIGLIRQLLNATEAGFSLSPNGGDPVEARFDLKGLAAAVFPLQEACHWK